jgi:hypothetical protein
MQAFVRELADRLRGTARFTEDLRPPAGSELRLLGLLDGRLVRAYHATRLLDHEADSIRATGLRPRTREFVSERTVAAFEHGAITREQRDLLLHQANVYAEGQHEKSDGKVYLFFGQDPLRRQINAVWDLLSLWGGEAVYQSAAGDELGLRIGRPSIVVADLDLTLNAAARFVTPGLVHLFVGHVLRLQRPGAEIYYGGPVPGRNIAAIWQPGQRAYDRFKGLPEA